MNSDPSSGVPPRIAPVGAAPPKLVTKKKKGRAWPVVLLGLLAGVALVAILDRRESPPESPPPPAPTWNPQRENRRPFQNRAFQPGAQPVRTPKPAKAAPREKVTGPRAAPPEFATPAGVYANEVKIELRAPSAAAKVRYTLDGSEPTTVSHEYTEPFAVDNTTLVKAKAFEPGVAPSVTAQRAFTLLDGEISSFTSNLPLVIVNTFGQQISKESTISAALRVIDAGQKRSSLTAAANFDGTCEIKVRGYSSLRFPKHSYTIKTRNDAGESLDAPLLGMPEDCDWVLYAPYSDKTLLRDVLAYDLSNKMGRYAARTRFVEVFLNRHGGKLSRRDYVGVYVLEEKIKRAPQRVAIKKLTPADQSEPNITGGYLFKRDHTSPPMDGPFGFFGQNQSSPSGDEAGFNTSRGLHLFYVDPKESEITSAQKTYLSRYLGQFERALYGADFKNPSDGYAKYLDVDSFIDQFWIVELSKNVDGFRYSCYMFKDRGGKLRVEPIWDWNLSFGNANYHQGWVPQQWYWRLLRDSEVCWFRRLSQDPDFMQRLTDRWAELRRGVFAPDNILRRIDEFAGQLSEAQARNYQRWPILGEHINPNWYVGESYEDEVNWMKNWIQQRIAWIDRQFLPPPGLSVATGKASLQADSGSIYYTLDGSDPRLPGGALSPKARPYTEPVLLPKGAQLVARAQASEGWSPPAKAQAR